MADSPRQAPPWTPPAGCDAVYDYLWADGSPAFKVVRWEARGDKPKRFSQWGPNGTKWVPTVTIAAGKKPLYRLPEILAAAPEIKVLLVEGEKKAAVAQQMLGADWLVTTWAGGAQSTATVDWSPLFARDVTMWPDNDPPGHKAAAAVRLILTQLSVIDLPFNFPEGWDLADPLPEGITPEWIVAKVEGALYEKESSPDSQQNTLLEGLIDPLNWDGKTLPVREWICPDLIPYHVPTMLSGMGGIGKTLLGMQLVQASATDKTWLGRKVKRVKAFAVFCEDDADEVQRRFHDINVGTDSTFGDLENLRLWIRDGMDSSLMEFDGRYGAGTPTEFFSVLVDQIKQFGAELILLDSLYNFFHGNENDRVQVTQFVGILRRMAKEANAALVFLAHPSKSGLSTGDGYAGSTAWHDAVRARLYFSQEKDEGSEETRLLLSTMKANYAAKGEAIEVYYEGGMLHPKGGGETQPVNYRLQAEFVFLKCLRECLLAGRNVSDSQNGSNYAPKVFSRMGLASGFRKEDLRSAMQSLFDQKRIRVGDYMSPYRKKLTGIFEVIDAPNLSHNDGSLE